MESKTKHRILGIVVVAGLAVLMYPFVQGNNSIPSEQAMVKAPPFPDQAIQVTSNENEAVSNTPADTIAANSMAPSAPPAATEQVDAMSNQQADNAASQDNSNVVNVSAPAANAANSTPAANAPALESNAATAISDAQPQPQQPQKDAKLSEVKSSLQSAEQPAAQGEDETLPNGPTSLSAEVGSGDLDRPSVDDIPAVNTGHAAPAKTSDAQSTKAASKKQLSANKAASKKLAAKKADGKQLAAKTRLRNKKVIKTAKANLAKPVIYSKIANKSGISAYRQMPIDNNGLVQLKQAAYVIQLGSFTEKTNALKLVNKLRAKGYRAFIQHTPGNVGENTRVFVGPEKQQASARLVATELEKEMQLHGIVISYKPFSL